MMLFKVFVYNIFCFDNVTFNDFYNATIVRRAISPTSRNTFVKSVFYYVFDIVVGENRSDEVGFYIGTRKHFNVIIFHGVCVFCYAIIMKKILILFKIDVIIL